MNDDSTGVEFDEAILGEVGPAEVLLWAGRPRQGLVMRGWELQIALTGILFLVPVAIISAQFIRAGRPQSLVCLAPFYLAGLHALVGRSWLDARGRRRTAYGLTSERIIIIWGPFRSSTLSLDLDTLVNVRLTEDRHGGGVITFGEAALGERRGAMGWPTSRQDLVPRFELAADAKLVFDMIREARRITRTPRD